MGEKQQFIDRFTRQDELLAQMIPILEDIRDQSSGDAQDVFVLSYPYDATHLTIAAGTTVYDFEHGTVMAPGADVAQMSNSLRQDDKTFMRSLVIDSNKDTVLQLDGQDKMIVHAGRWLFPYKQFQKVRITATESTDVFVVASTHPSTLDVAGESVIQGNDSGTLRTVAVDGSGNMVTLMKGDDGTNLQTIKVDAAGQMYVAMTGQSLNVDNHPSDYFKADESAIVKGDDGGTKRLIAVDASGIMLSRMKGAYGAVLKDILLDDTGIMLSRMKGSYGGTLKDIEVDTDGNMISVMKGDYEGALKTWKVDDEGRGEMFINDPKDVWGNVVPIGLGELAVRTHSPPMTFDRRGSVIFWDDFESATPKYDDISVSPGVISRSNDTCDTGSFSMKCVTGASGSEHAGLSYVLSDFHIGNIGIQVKFATPDSDLMLYLMAWYHDGAQFHEYALRWFDNGALQIINSAGNFFNISTNEYYNSSIHNFGTIELLFNLTDDKYDQLLIFGSEYDISSYSGFLAASALPRSLHTRFYFATGGGGSKNGYIDNIIIKEI